MAATLSANGSSNQPDQTSLVNEPDLDDDLLKNLRKALENITITYVLSVPFHIIVLMDHGGKVMSLFQ